MLTEKFINGAVFHPHHFTCKTSATIRSKDIPVLIEKPITASTAEGKNWLIPRAHECAHPRRTPSWHNSIVQEAKKLINSGSLAHSSGAFQLLVYKPDEYFDKQSGENRMELAPYQLI